ncbi:MAG: peptidoglycan endopeptidase [Geobacteraceae bacterium]|nr:peptidoglycan endopeptidase [Geobacteraceae bacterium]
MPKHESSAKAGPVSKGIHSRHFHRTIFSIPLTIILLALLTSNGIAASGSDGFAVATSFVPVFNTADFQGIFGGRDGKSLDLDRCAQIRSLEFIAMPGTAFRIEAVLENRAYPVYRVNTEDYPYRSPKGLYIDGRLVKKTYSLPQRRFPKLPPRETVLRNLISAQGSAYVWGGNRRTGIPEMLELYPVPPGFVPNRTAMDRWTLTGLDCSGLLYEATDGFTPRNTSSLVRYGDPVPIAGMDAEEITTRIKPLDLIVWNGHVMIALGGDRVIESRLDCKGKNGGVIIRGLREALRELCGRRVPMNEYAENGRNSEKCFVVRRWYPEQTSR